MSREREITSDLVTGRSPQMIGDVIRHQSVITNAESMFDYLHTNLTRKAKISNLCNHSRREYFLIENIDRTRPERMIATTLQGTRHIHYVREISFVRGISPVYVLYAKMIPGYQYAEMELMSMHGPALEFEKL